MNILYDQGLIKRKLISVRLGKQSGSLGAMHFGEIPKEEYVGDMLWVPRSDDDYWEIQITGFTVNGVDPGICNYMRARNGKCIAVIDSGTSVIALPKNLVKELHDELNLKEDCSNAERMPRLGIRVNGRDLTLDPSDYVVYDEGRCTLALMPLDVPAPKGPLIVLGATFMRKYFTVLDVENARIGFAEALDMD